MNDHVEAHRIRVRGIVQGVGFRPFVYRIAKEHGLSGWVLNDGAGVEIHVQGSPEMLGRFTSAVQEHSPPAARITELKSDPTGVADCTAFRILPSRSTQGPTTRISPDLPVCERCLQELLDAADRRHEYAYVNCTHCGPRYSIILRLPYDRANTTMSDWPLCPACQQEYDDPRNRRFHAQPTACPECGPRYRLDWPNDVSPRCDSGATAIRQAADLLRAGGIVAVKGIGGYHLACDARNAASVERLRARKFRKEKPFALMVRDLDHARALAELTPRHEQLLTSAARPIVLVRAKVHLPGVAPDRRDVGLMLPYAPLHHLLLVHGAPDPLVLTSANRSSEPIAYRDDDARERLAEIADALLVGERPIARRVDDSVVAVRAGEPLMIRRSRGYAPATVARLPSHRPILALGADLKSSIALVVDGEVVVGPYVGDLGDLETDLSFRQTVDDLLSMYDIRSGDVVVAHDLHPQFVSRRLAGTMTCHRRVAIQHHEAHLASVLAEHAMLAETIIGVALDGTGWGHDGAIWGFEIFHGSVQAGFQRRAWLQPVAMPGGDAAARFPLQAAAAFLAGLDDLPDFRQPPFSFPEQFFRACQLAARNVRCHRSSSAGRLFDAAAAVLGFTRAVSFEGQAAVWLEHRACETAVAPYAFDGFDGRLLLRQLVADRLAGRPTEEIAHAFHGAIAHEIAVRARDLAGRHPATAVAVSGGVMQNELLFEQLRRELAAQTDLPILRNQWVPANDGGISLGQAALACFAEA
jgi:hydrogenase maturation protein HypF